MQRYVYSIYMYIEVEVEVESLEEWVLQFEWIVSRTLACHKFSTRFSIVKTNLPNVPFIRYEIRASPSPSPSPCPNPNPNSHSHIHMLIHILIHIFRQPQLLPRDAVAAAAGSLSRLGRRLGAWGTAWGFGSVTAVHGKCKCHFVAIRMNKRN